MNASDNKVRGRGLDAECDNNVTFDTWVKRHKWDPAAEDVTHDEVAHKLRLSLRRVSEMCPAIAASCKADSRQSLPWLAGRLVLVVLSRVLTSALVRISQLSPPQNPLKAGQSTQDSFQETVFLL